VTQTANSSSVLGGPPAWTHFNYDSANRIVCGETFPRRTTPPPLARGPGPWAGSLQQFTA
jgi:hypothetical protein